jgi:hypothetical protein
MSGPKVVRVVTRDELVAEGEAALRRLIESVNLWVEECSSIGRTPAAEIERTLARQKELESVLRADRFQEFRTTANREIEFLEADVERRRANAAQARAREQLRRENGSQNARALLTMLRSRPGGAPAGLLGSLEDAAAGHLSMEEIDRILGRSFQAVTESGDDGRLTKEQQELARRLASAESSPSFAEWKASRVVVDARHEVALHQLFELEMLHASEVVAHFRGRLDSIALLTAEGARSIRYDSLLVELRAAKEEAGMRSQLRKALRLAGAELAAAKSASDPLLQKIRALAQDCAVKEMKALLQDANAEVASMLKERAAVARRRAILDGLGKLGYDVQEGMATALAQSGRVVVRNPSMPGYGVELAGGAEAGRLQVRAVAFATSRDATQDVNAETKWCADFGKLQVEVAARGGELVIERAMAVGAVPLRVVDSATVNSDRARDRAPAAARKVGG